MQKAVFGEIVDGYDTPVLNEREIRASAGILFLIMFISWMQIIFKENFTPIKYGITMFLIDFIIRIFIKPRYSPFLIIGKHIVRRQKPEYVGAAPKRLAWIIGLFLSMVMFVHMVALNSYSFITSIICLTCLTFLFFEAAFGICLGCSFYGIFHKEKPLYCPGDSCTVKAKKTIQKLSPAQIGVLIGFIALIILISTIFSGYLGETPKDLWNSFGEAN